MSDAAVPPPVRFVEAYPIEDEGQFGYYLRDPLEIAPAPLVLTAGAFLIATLLDGEKTIKEIAAAFASHANGAQVEAQDISRIVALLDENYLLFNPRFQQRLKMLQSEFAATDIRRARHAGVSYADRADELREQIEGFYRHPEGAGLPNGHPRSGPDEPPLAAIMTPHIDLRAGAPTYTQPYRHLIEQSSADLFIILGVAHGGSDLFFTTTRKHFETPLGIVKNDRAFLDAWQQAAGMDLSAGEWAHRSEHSIEFQLPFLQTGINRPFTIVPVLCGALEPLLLDPAASGGLAPVDKLIATLGGTIAASKRRVAVILSVDLAHVGPKFDDPERLTDADARRVAAADRKMFEVVSALDLEGFVELMRTDLIRRRVDACGALYTLLRLMKSGHGKAVSYGQHFQEDSGSLVSYGGMVFHGILG